MVLFSKAHLDPEFVRDEEKRITSGYLRLVELSTGESSRSAEYPLVSGSVPQLLGKLAHHDTDREVMISIDWRRRSLERLGEADSACAESRRLLFLDDDPIRAEAFLLEEPEAVWVKTVTDCVVSFGRAVGRSSSRPRSRGETIRRHQCESIAEWK